jgi:teichuronic acid biosynthesis glycosyltransferase TuaC
MLSALTIAPFADETAPPRVDDSPHAPDAAARTAAGRPLRIALVTPVLPVPHDQTRGRYIFETARALAKLAQVRVFFQSLRYPNVPGLKPRSFLHGAVGPGYAAPGIDVEAFDYPAIPVVTRMLNGVVSARELKPRVSAFAPDMVLAYWVYPDGYAALRVARSLKVPCVVGALGSDIHVRSGPNSWMTGRTVRQVDALLTVSEAMRKTAIETFGAPPQRVHTIVNGFNTTVFSLGEQSLARQALGLASADRIVLYVGRFVEAKGLCELIEAARGMAARDARFRLVLIGDGVMKDRLHELIQAAGLAQRVQVPGGMEPEGVARWIRACDVLTLPSWSEGYPNVVVEALACGRPVVATDVGGTREIVNAENGILIEPRDAAGLASALTQALDRPWNHAAIAAAMKRSWDDVARETLAVCAATVQASQKLLEAAR